MIDLGILKVDIGGVTTANQTLTTDVSDFNQLSSSVSLEASCSDGEVNALLNSYRKGLEQSLTDLIAKLKRYCEIVQEALSIIKEVDASFPVTEIELEFPTGLANLQNYQLGNVPWYKSLGNDAINKVYSVLGDSLVGLLPNFVTNGNPQGLTEFGNYVVGTDSRGHLYIYDKKQGTTKTISLGSEYHLGGISYHNGSLYVAKNETVSKYNFNDLLTKDIKEIVPVQYNSTTTTHNHSAQVSFLTTTNDGKLITGQFHHTGTSQYRNRGDDASDLLIYNIQNDGSLSTPRTITVPGNMTKIQGACVYQKNGQDYYLLTSSYGIGDSQLSKLYVATVGSDGQTLVKQKEMTIPAGAEQVTVTSDGNIAVMYEGKSAGKNITVLDSATII